MTVRVLVASSLFAGAGCGLLFPEPPPGGTGPASAPSPVPAISADPTPAPAPPAAGSLRQEEVSVTLRRNELLVRITPLDDRVTAVTAPDTHERLSILQRSYQELFRERTGSAVPFRLFLVSLHTEESDVTFEPEDLHLMNRGLRFRPVDIQPVTPDWDSRRLQPRQTAMAVYAFPPEVDLDHATEVEYRDVRSREWERILPQIERERARLGVP